MFDLSGQAPLARADQPPGAGPWMFLAPTVADPQASELIEEVRLLRGRGLRVRRLRPEVVSGEQPPQDDSLPGAP